MMESIDRLREYVAEHTDYTGQYGVYCTTSINDLIYAVEREAEECYIELPKDADGEYIHIGDMLDCGEVCRIEIASDGDHKAYVRKSPDNPHLIWSLCRYSHHKAPAVEDALMEFFEEYDSVRGYAPDENKVLADFSKRLQLREEG